MKRPNDWEMKNDFMVNHNGYEKMAYVHKVFKNGMIVLKFRSWPHSCKCTESEFAYMRNQCAELSPLLRSF